MCDKDATIALIIFFNPFDNELRVIISKNALNGVTSKKYIGEFK